jgi:hypothetical protein
MHARSLGSSGPTVSAIGLGRSGMSDLYGPADERECLAVLRAALEAAVPAEAIAGTRYDAHQMRVLDSERVR